MLLGNIHPALQLEVLDQVQRPRLVVADTMNFWIGRAQAPRRGAEARRRPRDQRRGGAPALRLHQHPQGRAGDHARGPKRLIIKRGEHGALFFDEHGVFAAPGFPLEDVVDPTGAGDSFAGGFMGYLATQPEVTSLALRRAMIHATATASFCVEAVGTKRVAEVTRADVAARVAAIRALYDFGAHTM
ncbi:MAG: PfkB family carbohydrate kinase [Minicystis sp.]